MIPIPKWPDALAEDARIADYPGRCEICQTLIHPGQTRVADLVPNGQTVHVACVGKA